MKNIIERSREIDEEYEDDEIITEGFDPEQGTHTFVELVLGIAIFSLIAAIFILVLSQDRMYDLAGFLVGAAIALFMVWHMNRTIRVSVDMTEDNAKSYMIKHYVIRTLVCFVVMVAVVVFKIGNIILTLLGIIGLKVAVYLQPFTDKCFKKMKKGG